MVKKIAYLLVAAAFAVSLSACGKQKQEEPSTQAPAPEENLALPEKGQEATVELPPDVKGKWKAIKVVVEDKKAGKKSEMTINIGAEAAIPGSKLTIKAVDYVPSFVMQGLNITSASNEPNNPAAKVVILEGGQEVFKGWLFQKFPTTHAFTHPDFAVTLADGVKS
ncbi:MAG: DUF2155 domain-containing protein [Nitrospirae bacterium]|nr:DUF2155 domain-containing protein [Nitrospirota bacterium]MBI5695467.1 DUF2155 domain-containing protein [Nitrospirota bacterium]